MSHMVPEAWHEAPTRDFLRAVFKSEPRTPVPWDFITYINGNMPYFMSSIVQYSLERAHPVWLVAFYDKSVDKHVGATWSEEEGAQQIYALDPDYRRIAAVKLSPETDDVARIVNDAKAELYEHTCYSRPDPREANIFHVSDAGDLTASLFRDRAVADGPSRLANCRLGRKNVLARTSDGRIHRIPKFDPLRPEAAYYRSSMGGVIPISPLTMAAE